MLNFYQYLNPIYKDKDKINDFSDILLEKLPEIYKNEYSFLKRVTNITGNILEVELSRLNFLIQELENVLYEVESSHGNDKDEAIKEYNRVMKMIYVKIDLLNRYLIQLDIPYFGKIIFKRKASGIFSSANIQCYIGKFAMFDKDTNENLITDWRAPIANLYYKNSGPRQNVSFITPAGMQEGDLTNKMQLDINRARINNIYEAKTGNTAADEFLLSQLKKKIGKKLTDIVSTIQDMQNEIIRHKPDNPTIIQGVAGSGKTTILLHRIAYLIYAYSDIIEESKSLIIAPNKLFIDYISDVLPSLGVNYIKKNTYLLWAKTVLNWDERFLLSNEADNLEIKSFKGSILFKDMIEKYLEDFEYDLFDKLPDQLNLVMYSRYNELKKNKIGVSLEERVLLSAEFAFAQQQFNKKTIGFFSGDLEKNELRLKNIRQYIKKRVNIYTLYRDFFKLDYIFKEFEIDSSLVKKVKTYTLKYFKSSGKNKFFKIEDLSGLVWMNFYIYGYKSNLNDFVAVDEAQDLSVFQLLTLLKVSKNNNITYAGDLAQSIIPPFYISDWNDLLKPLTDLDSVTNVYFSQLDKCYRTTIEIIDFANKIFKEKFPSNYALPQAILRHGDKPRVLKFNENITENNSEDIKTLIISLNKEFEKKAVTVALICKNYNHADKVYDILNSHKEKLTRQIYKYDMEDYHDGILILPVEKAKGLEFDSVYILDLNEDFYPNDDLSIRLLYVSMTRALHRLTIIYNSKTDHSPLIKSIL